MYAEYWKIIAIFKLKPNAEVLELVYKSEYILYWYFLIQVVSEQ
jgi:hypothetical protein